MCLVGEELVCFDESHSESAGDVGMASRRKHP